MSIDELEQVIAKYNLSVRRIPDVVYSTHDIRHHKDGDEVITWPSGRKFTRKATIPRNAGMWLVKQVPNTLSIVRWEREWGDVMTGDSLESCIMNFLDQELSTRRLK